MPLVFVLMGLLIVGLGLYGLTDPRVRRLEEEIPDALAAT
jgi:hypothetical protein